MCWVLGVSQNGYYRFRTDHNDSHGRQHQGALINYQAKVPMQLESRCQVKSLAFPYTQLAQRMTKDLALNALKSGNPDSCSGGIR